MGHIKLHKVFLPVNKTVSNKKPAANNGMIASGETEKAKFKNSSILCV